MNAPPQVFEKAKPQEPTSAGVEDPDDDEIDTTHGISATIANLSEFRDERDVAAKNLKRLSTSTSVGNACAHCT